MTKWSWSAKTKSASRTSYSKTFISDSFCRFIVDLLTSSPVRPDTPDPAGHIMELSTRGVPTPSAVRSAQNDLLDDASGERSGKQSGGRQPPTQGV